MEFNFHLNYGQKNRKNKSRADLRECSFCFYSLSTLSQVLNVLFLYCEQSVAYDRSSAPKDCRVSGWLQGRDLDLPVDGNKMFLLAEFTYDLEKSSAQTFDVFDAAGVGTVDTVRLDFTSNHGSPSHTCIYRLRVHGHEPDSVSMVKMQS